MWSQLLVPTYLSCVWEPAFINEGQKQIEDYSLNSFFKPFSPIFPYNYSRADLGSVFMIGID